jgi:predicted ribosome quality control (RQC) complex YloA/Tae2 family protein
VTFDALTMAAIADELRATCVGGRIQAVLLPAPQAIGMEIYAHHADHYLFASAHPQHARVHLTKAKLSKGSEDITPLLLLMRKYVRDGRLAAVEQPPLERTLSLIITKAHAFDKGHGRENGRDVAEVAELPADAAPATPTEISTVTLTIEVMGRYSNIILIDSDGVVLEAVKHIGADVNRYRVTLPNHPYSLPPPQAKEDPRAISAPSVERLMSGAPTQPAWQALVKGLRGVSPLLAREAVYRASGSPETVASSIQPQLLSESLAGVLLILSGRAWSPCLVREGAAILDFAPYELKQFAGHVQPVDSISAAVQEFYGQEVVAAEYSGLKQQVGKALAEHRQRVVRRRESLQLQQNAAVQAESLRVRGEMILAYAAQIERGQTYLDAEMETGQPALHIRLDPLLSPIENAQEYFRRYTQARDAGRALPPLIERVTLDLSFLDQLQLDLDMAAKAADIREVQRTLAATDERTPAKKQTSRAEQASPPLSVRAADGTEIIVGRNARQNDYVTFEVASPLDTWLHARGVPGSHVIIRNNGRPVSSATLEQAARLAAEHSAARSSTTVAVDYTTRRNVRRARSGAPGMVHFSGEKTLTVRPATPS